MKWLLLIVNLFVVGCNNATRPIIQLQYSEKIIGVWYISKQERTYPRISYPKPDYYYGEYTQETATEVWLIDSGEITLRYDRHKDSTTVGREEVFKYSISISIDTGIVDTVTSIDSAGNIRTEVRTPKGSADTVVLWQSYFDYCTASFIDENSIVFREYKSSFSDSAGNIIVSNDSLIATKWLTRFSGNLPAHFN